jgi:hypothetical protein
MSFSKLAGALFVASAAVMTAQEARVPATAELQRMAARFVPTEITADVSRLSPTDRRVLTVGQRGDAARPGGRSNC